MLKDNIDIKFLEKNKKLSKYSLYLLKQWKVLHETPLGIEGRTNVWFNKDITDKTKCPLLPNNLLQYGYNRIEDFLDSDGRLLDANEAIARGLPKKEFMAWTAVYISIDKISQQNPGSSWKKGTVGDTIEVEQCTPEENYHLFTTSDTEEIPLLDLSQKKLLRAAAARRDCKPTKFEVELTNELNITSEEWQRIYRSTLKHSTDTKKREFIFKFYHNMAYTNKQYYIFGVKPGAKCSFCKHDTQTFLHLFMNCEPVQIFRGNITRQWALQVNGKRDWITGTGNTITDYIITELNYYIHKQNYHEQTLSSDHLKSIFLYNKKIEEHIATKNGKLQYHHNKWDKLAQIISDT